MRFNLKIISNFTKFEDIIGMEETKDTVQEIITDRIIFDELYSKSPIKISTSNKIFHKRKNLQFN